MKKKEPEKLSDRRVSEVWADMPKTKRDIVRALLTAIANKVKLTDEQKDSYCNALKSFTLDERTLLYYLCGSDVQESLSKLDVWDVLWCEDT